MTQFNLLPEIKLEYLHAEKQRRIVISVTTLVTAVSIILAVTLYTITFIQKHQINNYNKDITKESTFVSDQKNLSDILTVQNQIEAINTLHNQDPALSNLATYLDQLVPVNASIDSLNVDFGSSSINSGDTPNSIVLTGGADSLKTINQLVDILKFATYSVKGTPGSKNAFSSVVLTNFGINTNGGGPQATYTINCNFDPTLFNITDKVSLNVPSIVATRSQLEQPKDLFLPNSSVNSKGN